MQEKTNITKRGILIQLSKTNNDFTLRMDDVLSVEDTQGWKKECFISSKDYKNENFNNLDFNEKELADFGYFILARLHAFNKNGDI